MLCPAAFGSERLEVLRSRLGAPETFTMRPDGGDRRTVDALDSSPRKRWVTTSVVAPNGRDWVSFGFDQGHQTVVVHASDRPLVTLRTSGQALFSEAAYAPNGSALAVFLGTRIKLISLPSGRVVDAGPIPGLRFGPGGFFSDDFRAGPVWSPDSSRMVFLTRPAIVLVPADGGARQVIPWPGGIAGGDLNGVAWSPASDALAVAADNLYRLTVPGGVRTELATGLATSPAYAPDGTKIAYLRYGSLVVVSADGSAAVPLLGGAAVWSPDSTRLAFLRDQDGLHVARVDGSDDRLIATGVQAVIGWLSSATLPPDRSPARAIAAAYLAGALHGAFRDAPRSTAITTARVAVVQRLAHGRCRGLRSHRLRLMSCGHAGRSFVTAAIAPDINGPQWRLRVTLRPGRYTVRVRVRDAAGNEARTPAPTTIRVR